MIVMQYMNKENDLGTSLMHVAGKTWSGIPSQSAMQTGQIATVYKCKDLYIITVFSTPEQ